MTILYPNTKKSLNHIMDFETSSIAVYGKLIKKASTVLVILVFEISNRY
jgi:hypothetical protein